MSKTIRNIEENIVHKAAPMGVSQVVQDLIEATSIKVNNLVYELKQQGKDLTVLSLGEAYFDMPLYSMHDLPFPDIYHYSHSRGIIGLRRKLCDYYKNYYGVNVDPSSEILISSGSKAVIYFVLRALLNPGDEVIIYDPAWVSYPEQVKLSYGNPIQVPYWESVFNFEKYLTEKTKVIVINNPNNPTGKVYSKEELIYLVELARKHNLYVLSDEAYSDFLVDEKFYSLGLFDLEKNNVIICNSISKNFGISGWRIGYAITNKNLLNQILKLNQHIMTCPATILELYLEKHFEEIIKITYPQIKAVVEKRNKIASFMDSIGLLALPGTATFYFFVSLAPSSLTSEEFCLRLLQESYVAVVPGIGYGKSCDAFIRVSIGTESVEKIHAALIKIKNLIDLTTQKSTNVQKAFKSISNSF